MSGASSPARSAWADELGNDDGEGEALYKEGEVVQYGKVNLVIEMGIGISKQFITCLQGFFIVAAVQVGGDKMSAKKCQ